MRSTAFAFIATAALLSATPSALAADLMLDPEVEMSEAATMYLKVFGGATLSNALEHNNVDLDLDAGWMIGAAIGTEVLAPGVSVELDATASHALYTGYNTEQNSVALMANFVYTVPVSDMISAYAGAGVGAIGVQFEDSDYSIGAGGQVLAGLNLNVTEDIALFGEVRHQGAFSNLDIDGSSVEHARTSLMAGLKLSF